MVVSVLLVLVVCRMVGVDHVLFFGKYVLPHIFFDSQSHFREPKLTLYRLDHLSDSRMSSDWPIVMCLQYLFAYRRWNIDSTFEFEEPLPFVEFFVFIGGFSYASR
jgi:hypothetical protein